MSGVAKLAEKAAGNEVAITVILLFVMFIVFILLETCQEKYGFSFGHQASYILIIGVIISYILKAVQEENNEITEFLKFEHELFFYVCLPPIVYASGFNMNRGYFFANIKIVIIFGIIGTLISFSTFSLMTDFMNNSMEMQVFNGGSKEFLADGKTKNPAYKPWEILKMETREIVLMSSLLCSSDVIAAVSLVNQEKEPRLFNIVFGEGITNDAVSIILFNTVLKYTSVNSKFTASSPFSILGGFLLLGLLSLLIGAIFGFLSSWFLKFFRSLTHNAINETVVLLCFAYISYAVAEAFHESGIISLLFCGIIQAHYAYYNLSPMGQHASHVIFQFISFFMEAFVFIYLGTTVFSFEDHRWCPMLIVIQIFVIMIGRFIAVVGLLGFLKICKYDSKLSFKQQIFIWFAGMIRGAIAFGLVLKIDPKAFPNADIIATTTLVLVIFTTVFFGSILGLLQKCLFGSEGDAKKAEGITEPLVAEEDKPPLNPQDEMRRHYSLQNNVDEMNKEGCGEKFVAFDQKHIKPKFVHNYSVDLQNEVDSVEMSVFQRKSIKAQKMEKNLASAFSKLIADQQKFQSGKNLGLTEE